MKQQGAALVIVMALLSGALILGVSGMNSALIDERLAGNYRASVQAQMNSDSMMSDIHSSIIEDSDPDEKLNVLKGNVEEGEEVVYTWKEVVDLLGFKNTLDNTGKMKVKVTVEGDEVIITTQDDGTNNYAARQTVATYRRGGDEDSGSDGGGNNGGGTGDNGDESLNPFEDPIVGCEGVATSGTVLFGSYRSSSEIDWRDQLGRFSEQNKALIRTTSDSADINLNGSGEVYGSVEALGNVYLNSVGIQGDVFSNGSITSDNSWEYPVGGNLESVRDIFINNDTKVLGYVKAGGNIITEKDNFRVGEAIYAGGFFKSTLDDPTQHLAFDNRDNFFPYTSPGLTPLEPQVCDNFNFSGNNLSQQMSSYQSDINNQGSITVGSYPNNEWRITPEKIERYDETWNVRNWVDYASSQDNQFLGEDASLYHIDSLVFTGSPKLSISGGDVVLIIDGDFITGTGGSNVIGSIVIDEDSSLTVFAGGKVSLGTNVNISEEDSLTTSGRPRFSIFSNYDKGGDGVVVNGGDVSNNGGFTKVAVNIYAPFTQVSINSGRIFGGLRAKSIRVSGNSAIVYNEDLASAFYNGGAEGSEDSGSTGEGSWELADWR